MKFEIKGNKNYVGSIIQINNLIQLEGCDNIQSSIIFGCSVIISKDVKIGDVGIYFPTETALSNNFLSINNLYRDKELNLDKNKSGFFEKNRRIRAMKLRGFKSDGFFMPMHSLASIPDIKNNFEKYVASASIPIGTDFDHIDGQMICEKYIIKSKTQGAPNSKKDKKSLKVKRFNKLRDDIFRFHIDTAQLAKNMLMINPDDIISITEKVHGTSAIASYILCNRKLTWKDKLAKLLGAKVNEFEYDYIWSSRRVIKNQYLYEDKLTHFYSEDIWKTGMDELKPFIQKDMTIYYEIVGYLSEGKMIQGQFDYGCQVGKHEKYVYRITTTNESGVAFEWSMKQVQDWCKQNGLKAVPLHYYGYAKDLFKDISVENHWHENFLSKLQDTYLEKKCTMCRNSVPAEGVCLRKERLDLEVWTLKSFLFRAHETKEMDSGNENIEDSQEIDTV